MAETTHPSLDTLEKLKIMVGSTIILRKIVLFRWNYQCILRNTSMSAHHTGLFGGLFYIEVFKDAEMTVNVTQTSNRERSMDCLFSKHDTGSRLFCVM